MNEAVARILERYDCRSFQDHLLALREILQEIALLGLWRSKFFEKASFTADSIRCARLCPPGSFCRENARDTLPAMEESVKRPRLVRPCLVCC